MAVIVSKGIVVPYYGPPVGTTWLYEENGTFIVPADGIYQVEMHGGGGGGGGSYVIDYGDRGTIIYGGHGGGGSGELQTISLSAGDSIAVTIGAGGIGGISSTNGSAGSMTTFGSLSCAGGGGGPVGVSDSPGAGSGNIASSGTAVGGHGGPGGAGGYGNINNTAQTYGNGGTGGSGMIAGNRNGSAGQPGAVIITFMGAA